MQDNVVLEQVNAGQRSAGAGTNRNATTVPNPGQNPLRTKAPRKKADNSPSI